MIKMNNTPHADSGARRTDKVTRTHTGRRGGGKRATGPRRRDLYSTERDCVMHRQHRAGISSFGVSLRFALYLSIYLSLFVYSTTSIYHHVCIIAHRSPVAPGAREPLALTERHGRSFLSPCSADNSIAVTLFCSLETSLARGDSANYRV